MRQFVSSSAMVVAALSCAMVGTVAPSAPSSATAATSEPPLRRGRTHQPAPAFLQWTGAMPARHELTVGDPEAVTPYSWNLGPLYERYTTGSTRLMIVGDSISKMADERVPSGIVRRWSPPQGWNGGLVQPRNNGLFGFGNLIFTPQNSISLSYEFDDEAMNRVGENPIAPGSISEWAIVDDLIGTGNFVRFQIRSAQWAGPQGPDWMARDDFKGRLIYVPGPFGVSASMDLTPFDADGEQRGDSLLFGDDAQTQSIDWVDHVSGQTQPYTPPTSVVEFRVQHTDVIESNGDGHILLGCRVYLDDPTGFELATIAAGGASPADWANADLYTDTQLGRLFEACDSNVVLVYLGAVRGGDRATYKTNMSALAQRIETALATFSHREQPIIVLVSQHDMGGGRDTGGWSEALFEIARERSEAQSEVVYGYLNLHDLILDNLGTWDEILGTHMHDEVHPNQRGIDEFMEFAEAEILRGPREIVQPDSFVVPLASGAAGGLADLLDSDDSRLVLQAAPRACLNCPGVVVEVHGTANTTDIDGLTLLVETQASAPRIDQQIELYNFELNRWEVASVTIASVNGDQTLAVVLNTGAAAFVDATSGDVAARLSFIPLGPPQSPDWFTGIDQIIWELTSAP